MSTSISIFRAAAGYSVNLAVTASSGRVLVWPTAPAANEEPTVRLYNAGTVAVFFAFGDVTVTASTTTSPPLAPGATEVFRIYNTETYVAAITASGTATLYASPGHGA